MLPPIVETSSVKERLTPPSPIKTPDSKSSSRRRSISSPTRTSPVRGIPKTPGQSGNGNRSPEGRKPVSRRDSSTGLVLGSRRPSLGTIGTRVNSLLKAKNAFSRLKNKHRSKEQGEDDFSPECFEIKELPREPRFASTLSAEAQYAMLKGYEDVVYRNLCNQFPEQVHLLRRNTTPVYGIAVKVNEQTESLLASTPDGSPRKNEHYIDQVMSVNKPRKSISTDDSLLTPTAENRQTPSRLSPPVLTYSLTGSMSGAGAIQSETSAGQATTMDTEGSADKLPGLPRIRQPSQEKQKLVMTHRYHSVMDVLDILREQQGVHRLSPRVTAMVQQIEPVKEYNTWSFVWSREFESKQNADISKRNGMRNH